MRLLRQIDAFLRDLNIRWMTWTLSRIQRTISDALSLFESCIDEQKIMCSITGDIAHLQQLGEKRLGKDEGTDMAQAALLLRTHVAQPQTTSWVTPDAVSNLANTSRRPGKMNDLLAWHECSAMLDGNPASSAYAAVLLRSSSYISRTSVCA